MTTMAKTNHSLAAIFSLFLMLPIYCFNFGESSTSVSVKTWCVAKPSANDTELKNNIRFACEHTVPTDCDAINQGGPCYNPNNLFHHASFAMNSYYQEAGRHQWNCDFLNSALVAISDPSLGSCVYNGEPTSVDLSASGRWCVPIPMAEDEVLQSNINYACSRVDCSVIKYGGKCFEPNTLKNHASVAMNIFYQATGRIEASCDFNKTSLIVITDPSYEGCKFSFGK